MFLVHALLNIVLSDVISALRHYSVILVPTLLRAVTGNDDIASSMTTTVTTVQWRSVDPALSVKLFIPHIVLATLFLLLLAVSFGKYHNKRKHVSSIRFVNC